MKKAGGYHRDTRKPEAADAVESMQAEDDERRRRQMVAMNAQKPRHYSEDFDDPTPWQENAIRILEDRSE